MAQGWEKQELVDAILYYKKMQNDPSIVKAEAYKQLSEKYPQRTSKAFEYRMQNISYVLSLLGREWIPGLKPASHVGVNVIKQIEEILSEIESRHFDDDVILRGIVEEKRKTPKVLTPPKGNKTPTKKTSSATQYNRDAEVVAWVLTQSEGKCESCMSDAPFIGSDGLPFLEVHHVKHLADKGSDTITNAVALCPNCHRELHYGINSQLKKTALFAHVKRLISE
jgi:5-methylcytosine-specific restriction enzyme A